MAYPIQRILVISLVAVLFAAFPAQAGLIQVDFASTLQGPLAGTAYGGTFTYDDLGSGFCDPTVSPCTPFIVPMLSMSLHIGSHHYDLSHAIGLSVVHLPAAGLGLWGPSVGINPAHLFGGLTSFGLGAGGNVFVNYTYSSGQVFSDQLVPPHWTMKALPPQSVPESSALFLSLVPIIVAGIRLRKCRC